MTSIKAVGHPPNSFSEHDTVDEDAFVAAVCRSTSVAVLASAILATPLILKTSTILTYLFVNRALAMSVRTSPFPKIRTVTLCAMDTIDAAAYVVGAKVPVLEPCDGKIQPVVTGAIRDLGLSTPFSFTLSHFTQTLAEMEVVIANGLMTCEQRVEAGEEFDMALQTLQGATRDAAKCATGLV
ncbi:hypothetical protein PT974_07952 [Cladobotryum mycophilum]|uniref:Uncharacterized protein n=1 Tax=Cladobotryum mycophilum TaxID=491253 RepID=A0ABR0SC05_9HYPO